MSDVNIKTFYKFCRLKVIKQSVNIQTNTYLSTLNLIRYIYHRAMSVLVLLPASLLITTERFVT